MDMLRFLFPAGPTITPWIPINSGPFDECDLFQIEWQTSIGSGGSFQVDYLAGDGVTVVSGGAIPGQSAGANMTANAGGCVTSPASVPNSAQAVRVNANINASSAVMLTLRGFTSSTTLGVPVVGIQGLGYMVGGFGANFVSTASIAAAALVAAPNEVRFAQFMLDAPISIGHVSMTIVGILAANFAYAGIYDQNGNLLLDAGQISTAAAATVTKAPTAVILQPGIYYFAWSASSATPTANGLPFAATGAALLNAFKTRYGVAANAVSGGALPATLGALTASSAIASVPFVVFEP